MTKFLAVPIDLHCTLLRFAATVSDAQVHSVYIIVDLVAPNYKEKTSEIYKVLTA